MPFSNHLLTSPVLTRPLSSLGPSVHIKGSGLGPLRAMTPHSQRENYKAALDSPNSCMLGKYRSITLERQQGINQGLP